jgi:hypothetical protein
MTLDEIETALGQHLAAMPNCPPIAWGNKSADHPKPYIRTLHSPVSRIDATIDCSLPEDKIGLWMVTVVSESDQFTTQANTIAEAIAQHFRQGKRLAAGSGNVLIDRAEPVAGFHDDANDWNVPVRMRYRSEG